MKRALASLAMLAAFAAAPALAGPASPLAGEWQGHGTDNRGDQFQVVLVIHPDGSGRIGYDGQFETTYSCRAQLLPVRQGPRGARVFREAVGEGTCINGAEVTLTPRRDGGLGFSWRGFWEERGVNAHTVLSRVR